MRFLFILLVSFVTGCGPLEWNKSDTEALCKANPAQCQPRPEPTVEPEPLAFSGYVQRAFTITVNGLEFNDAEDLYTRFDELLEQERFQDAQFEVEGNYRVDTFGSNSRVFVVSQDRDGHAFEATTQRDGSFRFEVGEEDVSEETFKAKVVVRIGLKVTTVEQQQYHYCYLLYGFRDNVVINDESKPIIFDEFSTQLTTYDCDKHIKNSLVVPFPTPTVVPTSTPTIPTVDEVYDE